MLDSDRSERMYCIDNDACFFLSITIIWGCKNAQIFKKLRERS